jgi:TonB family protein
VQWKQWEGHVIDGKFHLRQYVGGSRHSAVFVTQYGSAAPQKAVIKLVPADLGRANAWLLRRELAARLSHPGLLPIFAFGDCQLAGTDLVYAVIERAEEDLSQVIPSRPLDPAEVREILDSVLETLAYLHAEGFVHGCLTPANVMAAGDRIKLSSDGLLRIGESSADLWAPDPNAAPEGRAGVTPAADVWSVGMLLVEALTQRPAQWDGNPATAPAVPKRLEAPFFDIARRSLRADPRQRCSIEDIARILHPAATLPHQPAVVAAAPAPMPAAPKAAGWRQYLLPAAAVGVLLAGIVFTGALLTGAHVLRPAPVAAPQATVPSSAPAVVDEKPTPFAAAPPMAKTAPPSPVQPDAAPARARQPEAPAPAVDDSAAKLPPGDVVNRVMPEVPREILATIRGLVKINVRVRVDRSGSVIDAELDSRAGSKYFNRVVLDAARRWKFKPAAASDNAARSARLLRFECRPDACQASAVPAQP